MSDIVPFEYIHIPKCGGTSIRKALNIEERGHNPVRTNNNISDDMLVFSVVRNPFDRIASFYRWTKRRNVFRIKTDDMSFEDWFYKTIVYKERPYFYNPSYWKPCYWWLCDEDGAFRCNFTGKLETIEDDFNTICDLLGRDVILPELNTTVNNGEEVYTEDMKKIMYAVYKDDFKKWYPDA